MCGASPSLSLCSQDSRQSLSHVFKVSGKCGDAANNLTSLLWIFPPSYFPSCSIDPGRFPGQQQHMFDHQNPGLLINSNNHQIPSQGHMAFNQPSPGGFNQPGQGPGGQLGMFQREPPRPNLPPQGHPPEPDWAQRTHQHQALHGPPSARLPPAAGDSRAVPLTAAPVWDAGTDESK